jgi:hypothetical protein
MPDACDSPLRFFYDMLYGKTLIESRSMRDKPTIDVTLATRVSPVVRN